MTKRFAETTSVPVGRTKDHIEKELRAYGCTGFGILQENGRAQVTFKISLGAADRVIRISISLPDDAAIQSERDAAQENRRIWRSLFMVVKAKLESVASGIETFDEAFLPHILIPGPDGLKTAGERLIPQLEAGLHGQDIKLLT